MMDSRTERNIEDRSWRDLPLVIRDEYGNFPKKPMKLSPNLPNLIVRIEGDIQEYNEEFDKKDKVGVLSNEELEKSPEINEMLIRARDIVRQGMAGEITKVENLKDLVKYLDWSFEQQTGLPPNYSSFKLAGKLGVGAIDTLSLSKSIKDRLEK